MGRRVQVGQGRSQPATGIPRAGELGSAGSGAECHPWGARPLLSHPAVSEGCFGVGSGQAVGHPPATSAGGRRGPQLSGSGEGSVPRTNDMGMRSVERLQY